MIHSRELPYPINPFIQALKPYEPGLFAPASPSLCELTPNFLIDAIVLKSINGPRCLQLIPKRSLAFGYRWEDDEISPCSQIHPNYATNILLKSIGIPAGIVLDQPYRGLIVTKPSEPQNDKRILFVSRIWNDYRFCHHLEEDAISNELHAPSLKPKQRQDYEKTIKELAHQFTWASQAFLYLIRTQLGISIPEENFAVSRRS